MAIPAGGLLFPDQGHPFFTDFSRDLSVEVVEGWFGWSIAGYRINVPTSSRADVWAGTATTRPLPLAPQAMSVVSTSASDSIATALGAATALVTFIDEAGDWRRSDLLLLSGLTAVPITYKPTDPLVTAGALSLPPSPPDGGSVAASIFRVQSFFTATANGATEALPWVSNVGTMRVVDSATETVVFDEIRVGDGRASSGVFACPAGFDARLTGLLAGTARGQGTVYNALTRPGGASVRLPIAAIDSQTTVTVFDGASFPAPPGTDIKFEVIAASNNIDIAASATIRLRPIA